MRICHLKVERTFNGVLIIHDIKVLIKGFNDTVDFVFTLYYMGTEMNIVGISSHAKINYSAFIRSVELYIVFYVKQTKYVRRKSLSYLMC